MSSTSLSATLIFGVSNFLQDKLWNEKPEWKIGAILRESSYITSLWHVRHAPKEQRAAWGQLFAWDCGAWRLFCYRRLRSLLTFTYFCLSLSGACHEDVATSTSRRHAGLSFIHSAPSCCRQTPGQSWAGADHPQPFSARFASVFQFFVANS